MDFWVSWIIELLRNEPELIEMVKMRLEANGYNVITATDGQEGLEKARLEKPDLIILDELDSKDIYLVKYKEFRDIIE